MTTERILYYQHKISALREALDALAEELAKDAKAVPATPRKRRTFRQIREAEIEANILMGSVRKPKKLRKK